MQLSTLSAGLSKEHEMHDPDEGILAAFDSIAEASCVFFSEWILKFAVFLFIFSLFSSTFCNTTYLSCIKSFVDQNGW